MPEPITAIKSRAVRINSVVTRRPSCAAEALVVEALRLVATGIRSSETGALTEESRFGHGPKLALPSARHPKG